MILSVRIPFGRIQINIVGNVFVIALGIDNMFVIIALPDGNARCISENINAFGNRGFITRNKCSN